MGATGSCQRHAPRWGVGENGDEPVFFPLTLDWQFCGEHPEFPAWIEHEKASRKVDRPPAACATPIRLQPTEKKHVDRAVIDRKGDFNPNCDCLPYLSLEAGDALWESNVTTWTQLANLTEDDLRAMKGFPVDSIREVADKLAERGLGLRDSLSR